MLYLPTSWMKVMTATALFLLFALLHAWVGLWTIFTDYVKANRLRYVLHHDGFTSAARFSLAFFLGNIIDLMGCLNNMPSNTMNNTLATHTFDAVIVGGGGAGLRASLELAQSGLKGCCNF